MSVNIAEGTILGLSADSVTVSVTQFSDAGYNSSNTMTKSTMQNGPISGEGKLGWGPREGGGARGR